jgi:tRNA modification GTPase
VVAEEAGRAGNTRGQQAIEGPAGTDMNDGSTIAAISTPPGRGALAVVRVSGPEALLIAGKLGLPDADARVARHAVLRHPTRHTAVDDVVAVRFPSPASYTGEDMLEISCHGGSLAPQLVLEAVCDAGARLAEPGEFTRRAFLNGKLDLMQAEATLDLIDARSPAMHRAALFQLERGLSRRIEQLRAELVGLQALIAYDIDFPEEDDGPVPAARIDEAATDLRDQLARLLELAPEGELLRDGALTVIAGRTNAGKSSVFNALVGFERAIVTEEPGTTRDAIEALIGIGGYPFRLVDTAGLRDDPGRIEGMGIDVARGYVERADLVLLCVEADREPGADEREFVARLAEAEEARLIVLRTKTDRSEGEIRGELREARLELPVSAHAGDGLPELRTALVEGIYAGIRSEEDTPVVTRARHVACLARAQRDMDAFHEARSMGMPAEICGTHVQDATLALEDLLGVVTQEDVLDRVFGAFCVGK